LMETYTTLGIKITILKCLWKSCAGKSLSICDIDNYMRKYIETNVSIAKGNIVVAIVIEIKRDWFSSGERFFIFHFFVWVNFKIKEGFVILWLMIYTEEKSTKEYANFFGKKGSHSLRINTSVIDSVAVLWKKGWKY